MAKTKVTITIESNGRTRLARECAKLDAHEERAMANEALAVDAAAWPEY